MRRGGGGGGQDGGPDTQNMEIPDFPLHDNTSVMKNKCQKCCQINQERCKHNSCEHYIGGTAFPWGEN